VRSSASGTTLQATNSSAALTKSASLVQAHCAGSSCVIALWRRVVCTCGHRCSSRPAPRGSGKLRRATAARHHRCTTHANAPAAAQSQSLAGLLQGGGAGRPPAWRCRERICCAGDSEGRCGGAGTQARIAWRVRALCGGAGHMPRFLWLQPAMQLTASRGRRG
jgi:hypothetical protein